MSDPTTTAQARPSSLVVPSDHLAQQTVKSFFNNRWRELRMVADGYSESRVPRMAAALSYFTIFSLAPLLVIAVAIAGFAFGEEAARGQLTAQFRTLVGVQGGEAAETMILHAHQEGTSLIAALIGIVTLLIGSTGVFGELQDSLNTIWKVRTKSGRTLHSLIRSRILSFTMVFGIGFLLLVSLVLSAVLTTIGTWLHGPPDSWQGVARVSDMLVSFVAIGLLFAASFKLLPDVSVRWRDVWSGALVTSLLFVIGKFLIGLYLGKSAISSTYGSMGALAVLLIWIYYSSQVFLIGALFTRARALLSGTQLTPRGEAEWIPGYDPTSPAQK